MVGSGPVEPGALGDKNLLVKQQIENQLLVINDVVHLGVKPREDVERAFRLDAGDTRYLVEFLPRQVTLLEQSAAR